MAETRVAIFATGLRETLVRLRRLPDVANREIRVRSQAIAAGEADRIRAAGAKSSRQSKRAAESVRARLDRVPVIVAGGGTRVPGLKGATYGDLFFGAEFGGEARKTTQQFRPHKGTEGYWFWPTLRDDETRIFDEWHQVVDAVEKDWAGR